MDYREDFCGVYRKQSIELENGFNNLNEIKEDFIDELINKIYELEKENEKLNEINSDGEDIIDNLKKELSELEEENIQLKDCISSLEEMLYNKENY